MLKWTNAYMPRSCHAIWRADGVGIRGGGGPGSSLEADEVTDIPATRAKVVVLEVVRMH
jgi:ribosomal protein S12